MEKEGRFVVARDGDGEIGVIGKVTGFFGGDANVLKLIAVLDVPSLVLRTPPTSGSPLRTSALCILSG